MRSAAQFFAEEVEFPDPRGREPDEGDQARHQIHLDAKLRHGEIVQNVDGAEQRLDRFADGKMHLRARYQDVVASEGIVRIDAKRILVTDIAGIDGAQHAVLPGEAIAPVPLPAHGLEHRRVLRDVDELRPDKQAGGQHSDDSDRGQSNQPPLELFVLGFVVRQMSLPLTVTHHAIGHEQIHGDENGSRDPERERYGVVDRAPIGRDWCEIPWTQQVKQNGADDQQDQHDC